MIEKIKILVVEDEPVIAANIRQRLIELGYESVEIALTGEEALLIAQEFLPSLVLMDIHLSGEIGGIETAEKIGKMYDIPIIYLTAFTDDDTLNHVKLTHPYGYILKPLKMQELRTTVEIALYRHSLNQQFAAREQWFSATLRGIGDGIVEVDKENKIIIINPIVEALTGWRCEEAQEKPFSDVCVVEIGSNAGSGAEIVWQVIEQNKIIHFPKGTTLISRDGARIPVGGSAAPIVDHRRNVIGAIVVIKELSKEESQGVDYFSTRSRFNALEKACLDTVLLVQTDGMILDYSEGIEKLPCENFPFLAGKLLSEYFPPPAVKILEKALREYRPDEKLCRVEFPCVNVGGNFTIEARIVHCGNDEAVIVLRDITKQKEKESEQSAIIKEKEILVREVHHRVKNNFQIISSIIYLQKELVTDPQALSVLFETERRIKSMALIHEKLHSVSDFTNVNAQDYFEGIINDLEFTLCQRDAGIHVHSKIDPVNLSVNQAFPCAMIINELVMNAYKHAFLFELNGKISVTFASGGNKCLLTVKDNGVGIMAKNEPEKQVSLGLQLVDHFAAKLGGTVRCNNHQGTEIIVEFPLMKEE